MSNDLGIDRSGNGNNWTVNNIAFADQVVDSPTNNFATIDPLSSGAGAFSEGNLKYASSADTGVGTFGISSGKAYAEVTISSAANQYIGVCDISRGINPLRGGGWSDHGGIAYKFNGDQYKLAVGSNTSASASYGASYTNGDIIGIAIDVDNDTITFYKNGSSQGNTASGPSFLSSGGVYSIMIYGGSDMIFIVNFGQDSSFAGTKTAQGKQDSNDIGDFYYTPPTGYLALCTKNLPNVDVVPSEHFNTLLYTGDGASTHAVTGVGFQPDWVWLKHRTATYHHSVWDSVRGVHKQLYTSGTHAEADESTSVKSFDTDGFTLGNKGNVNNDSGAADNFVAWNWKAGTSVSGNSSGSGTTTSYTGSVNTDAGFSIIKYTGNATAGLQIPHHLGVVPDAIFIKSLTVQSWNCFFPNTSLGATKGLQLDNTGAEGTVSHLNNTMPSTSVVTLGTGAATNTSADGVGQQYIMYSFANKDGYSKVGSYTGNGNADGTFVYTGFRPAFTLIKKSSASGSWWEMVDNKRSPINVMSKTLYANQTDTEYNSTSYNRDFTSNGFKIRNTNAGDNTSGETYIYIAFAETPFKYSNAR